MREAFRDSVNLPFVRLMRDVVDYYVRSCRAIRRALLERPEGPAPRAYLERFAARGRRASSSRASTATTRARARAALARLCAARAADAEGASPSASRSLDPERRLRGVRRAAARRCPRRALSDERLRKLYGSTSRTRFSLADRGYLARVHPLELWLVGYLRANPARRSARCSTRAAASARRRYPWLFSRAPRRAGPPHPHPARARGVPAHPPQWKETGYPFESLVPSLRDRDRQLRRPPVGARRARGHHRQRRRAPADVRIERAALRRRHALRDGVRAGAREPPSACCARGRARRARALCRRGGNGTARRARGSCAAGRPPRASAARPAPATTGASVSAAGERVIEARAS